MAEKAACRGWARRPRPARGDVGAVFRSVRPGRGRSPAGRSVRLRGTLPKLEEAGRVFVYIHILAGVEWAALLPGAGGGCPLLAGAGERGAGAARP